MIIAEFFIAAPVIAAITMGGVASVPKDVRLQAMGLGASRWQTIWLVLREARVTILSAIVAGFGAAISEVGAVMMVGGNLSVAGHNLTGTMTTATMAQVRQGNYATAMAFGLILLAPGLHHHLLAHPHPAGHQAAVAAVMTRTKRGRGQSTAVRPVSSSATAIGPWSRWTRSRSRGRGPRHPRTQRSRARRLSFACWRCSRRPDAGSVIVLRQGGGRP